MGHNRNNIQLADVELRVVLIELKLIIGLMAVYGNRIYEGNK